MKIEYTKAQLDILQELVEEARQNNIQYNKQVISIGEDSKILPFTRIPLSSIQAKIQQLETLLSKT